MGGAVTIRAPQRQPAKEANVEQSKRPRVSEWLPSFWFVEDRGFVSPCHIWILARDQRGYGRIHQTSGISGSTLAYVESWVRQNGEIPEGLELDHLCRQPSCINTEHLETVTHGENVRRGRCTRMTPDVLAHIFELRDAGCASQKIADETGFHRVYISAILRGVYWSDTHPMGRA